MYIHSLQPKTSVVFIGVKLVGVTLPSLRHLLSALPRWKTTREGLERLDAELQAEMLERSKGGQWSCALVVSVKKQRGYVSDMPFLGFVLLLFVIHLTSFRW